MTWQDQYTQASQEIAAEALRARMKFPPFNSAHEGASVLREEFEEMWDEVKADNLDDAISEAIQTGAMALRFIADMRAKRDGSATFGEGTRQ